MRWEYRTEEMETVFTEAGWVWVAPYHDEDHLPVEERSRVSTLLEEVLASAGAEGWELVAFLPAAPGIRDQGSSQRRSRMVFKRPLG